MNHLLYWFNRITKKHRELRRWQRIVTVLAAIMTFATTYALILPAITVEKNRTEEVAGMYLERSADGNAMLEENAPEPTEIDASDVQEGEETAPSNSDAADGEEITAARLELGFYLVIYALVNYHRLFRCAYHTVVKGL